MAAKPQFSLRWMFVAVAAVALVLGEAVGFPEPIAEAVGLIVTSLLAPAVVSGMVYARGYGRAFVIGALSWWFATAWIMGDFFPGPGRRFQLFDGGRIDFSIWWTLAFAGGVVAVVVRRLTLPKSPNGTE
ncbi:MAG TPA: hypothetical protein PK867_21100 [Pirellulales bacterium]|nr:hypothetical protein [Pirellulales bacterium]